MRACEIWLLLKVRARSCLSEFRPRATRGRSPRMKAKFGLEPGSDIRVSRIESAEGGPMCGLRRRIGLADGRLRSPAAGPAGAGSRRPARGQGDTLAMPQSPLRAAKLYRQHRGH